MDPRQIPQASNPRVIPSQIDLKNTEATACEKCGGEAFQEAVLLRKVSSILTGTGKEGYLPVQVFACIACGHVNRAFLPAEIRPIKIETPSGD
ncbi:hypothetical protein E2P64_06210 [Candidatus Bathyarchaeota archaeon]|nr:hypothetical protein E2P64_06210 [Candidatus Bathyarchaeota archaeon]